ncbi:MAG: MFS transporter, partial [Anaerolineaceae bacterium]|nr:MFS transporter [Anaerolineaceae bacterium]
APAGYLGDHVGSRPVMLASWILGTAATIVMALANGLPSFVVGMLMYGLTSFVVAPMNSYITSVRGKLSVERSLTITMAMFFLGAVAGSLLGGVIGEALGLQNIYRISALIFVVSTLIVLQARSAPHEEHDEIHTSQPNLARNPRFIGLLVLIFFTMFALYLPQPLTPNYLQNEKGFSLQTIGQLGAIGNLGNALLMLGFGYLSAPIGFMTGQALVGLFALLMWRSESTPLFFLGYFLLGGYRLSRSMVLAHARKFVKPSEIGFAFGLVETGNAISTILAPLAAGLLYIRGPQLVYIASLAGTAIIILANAILLPKPQNTRQAMAPKVTPVGGIDAP